jgi:acetyl-CoA carboxylase biotin carboxyl carrier protein
VTSIEAPVSGIVIAVWVQPGQTVSPGIALLLIESMKMEIPVEAQTAGVVSEIRVAKGDEVKEGEVVVVLK